MRSESQRDASIRSRRRGTARRCGSPSRGTAGLTARLERVVTLRLGLAGEDPQTLAQIAAGMGVSRERIRQLQEKAFRMLATRGRRKPRPDGVVAPEQRLRALLLTEIRPEEPGAAERAVELAEDAFASRATELASSVLLGMVGVPKAERRELLAHALTSITTQRGRELRARRSVEFHQRIGQFIAWPSTLRDPKEPVRPGRAREINELGTLSIKSQFQSAKLKRSVACESRTELAFFMRLEAFENVVYYQEQPFVVPYTFQDRSYHYYPDVLFVLDDGRSVLAEIKQRTDFGQIRDLVKWAALWDFCRQRGYGLYIGDARTSFQGLLRGEFPAAFEARLLAEVQRGPIGWVRYVELAAISGVKPGIPAPIVLRHRLEWRLRPFELRAAAGYVSRLDDLYRALGPAEQFGQENRHTSSN